MLARSTAQEHMTDDTHYVLVPSTLFLSASEAAFLRYFFETSDGQNSL
jgi:hypothetical protein